jgi:membrane protease YdiL (CAAX protease family)
MSLTSMHPSPAEQVAQLPVKKRYLALYFVLAIPLAWAFWIPMILINRGVWTLPVPVPTLVWSTLGALSPLLTIGIIERVSRKEIQLRAILGNIRWQEVRLPWILPSAFFVIGVNLVMTLIYFGVETARGSAPGPVQNFKPDVFGTLGWWILLIIPIHFVPSLITSPLFEEPGWRGFAFENLRHYMPRDAASLIVGSYWWLWHQGMNLAFAMEPSLYGYLSMLLDSVAIDALYTLSGRNLLAAMLAHQAMGTVFTFLFPLPTLWYLLAVKLIAVAALRFQVHRRAIALG